MLHTSNTAPLQGRLLTGHVLCARRNVRRTPLGHVRDVMIRGEVRLCLPKAAACSMFWGSSVCATPTLKRLRASSGGLTC